MKYSYGRVMLLSLLLFTFLASVGFAQPAPVTNLDTGETFRTIQAAIDDSDTDAGDTIEVNSSTYDSSKEPGGHSRDDDEGQALIVINKSLTIRSTNGPNSTVIDGRGNMVTIGIEADGVHFTGFTVTGAEIPSGRSYSVGIDGSGNANTVIANNIIVDNQQSGIDVSNAIGCVITKNVVKNMQIPPEGKFVNAIVAKKSSNIEISENLIHHIGDPDTERIGASGVFFKQTKDSLIKNNEIYSIGDNALILVGQSSRNRITGNTVYDTYFRGLLLFGESNNNKVIGNEFSNSRHFGVGIEKASVNNTVSKNIVSGNQIAGIDVLASKENYIFNNSIKKNGESGIRVRGSSSTIVKNNTITDNGELGIDVFALFNDTGEITHHARNIRIVDNEISGTVTNKMEWAGYAIHIATGAKDNTVLKNRITDNRKGIDLYATTGNTIKENIIQNNKLVGIKIGGSSNNTISQNDIKKNGDFGVDIIPGWNEKHTKMLHDSKNNEIIDNEITEISPVTANWKGVGVNIRDRAELNKIKNNSISNSNIGIQIWNSTKNRAIDNEIRSNKWDGIVLGGNSDGNSIVKNEISGTYKELDNGNILGVGILCQSLDITAPDPTNDNNLFLNNNVHDNAFGVLVGESNNATVKNNTIENNSTGKFSLYSGLVSTDTKTWELITEFSGGGGIHVIGPNNEITANTVTGNGFGVEIQGGNSPIQAEGNVVKNNTVKNNNSGDTTLILKKWENTTQSSDLTRKRKNTPYPQINISSEFAQPKASEETKTIKLANPGSFGLLLVKASNTVVTGNDFKENGGNGIVLRGYSFPEYHLNGESSENHVEYNEAIGHEEGIDIGRYARNNYFVHNGIEDNEVGVRARASSGNRVKKNSIVGNASYGLKNENQNSLSATENWWGDRSGPHHPQKNPEGEGDTISNYVKFDPWLKEKPEIAPQHPQPQIATFNRGTWWVDANGNGKWDGPNIDIKIKGFGSANNQVAIADLDNDGVGELATFRAGTWWVDKNNNFKWDGPKVDKRIPGFGTAGNKVAAADFDNDGKAEIATFNRGTWWIDLNNTGTWDGEPTDKKVQGYGNANNQVAAADFDGDGQGEIATFSAGTWWIDMNNNDKWDGPDTDRKVKGYGNAGNIVAAGNLPTPSSSTSIKTTGALGLTSTLAYPNPVTSPNRVTFKARGKNIDSTKLTVFTASGSRVYDTNYLPKKSHSWNLTTKKGEPVPNGIYLYQLKARGAGGKVTASLFRKLLVLG